MHDANSPLDYDLIVVDEASMLSLPLSARLLEAVPDECRLVLVGDPDQLSSIDVGAVLGDVVSAAGVPGSALAGCLVRLTRQHRTGEASPIGPLAEAIRRGDADDVVDLLRAGTDERLRFVETADGEVPDAAVAAVLDAVTPAYSAAREAALVDERAAALDAAGAARVLCGHRRGPFGVAWWNQVVEAQVAHLGGDAVSDIHPVAGRVLLATRNDPRTGLANGDQGVLVRVGRGDPCDLPPRWRARRLRPRRARRRRDRLRPHGAQEPGIRVRHRRPRPPAGGVAAGEPRTAVHGGHPHRLTARRRRVGGVHPPRRHHPDASRHRPRRRPGVTPATRTLEDAGVAFTVHEFAHADGARDFGREAAAALAVDPDQVFKTLVVVADGVPAVAVVPVSGQLSLKAVAAALGAKRAELCDPQMAERTTGYVVGGISPFGQRRRLATVIDETCELFDTIYVSGGRRGLDLGVAPADLVAVLAATVAADHRLTPSGSAVSVPGGAASPRCGRRGSVPADEWRRDVHASRPIAGRRRGR